MPVVSLKLEAWIGHADDGSFQRKIDNDQSCSPDSRPPRAQFWMGDQTSGLIISVGAPSA